MPRLTVEGYMKRKGKDMDKRILNDYIDACEVIKETEEAIKKLERKQKVIVRDKVKGSSSQWPYESRSFTIEGVEGVDANKLEFERHILEMRQKAADDLRMQVEKWLLEIPFRMQRIIRYKFFEDMKWEEVAMLMGRKATGDSVRMEFNNYMQK